MKLGAVRLFVRDVAEARRFYAERLGLTVQSFSVDRGVCVLDTRDTRLVVEAVAADAPAEDQALVGRFTGDAPGAPLTGSRR
ncbi:MAG TPA: VOC family protein [Steroidobacteraceae bacterium]|jgi:catechol 2,3-dioxygenase-like lactoylglutathione lyase family enzyme